MRRVPRLEAISKGAEGTETASNSRAKPYIYMPRGAKSGAPPHILLAEIAEMESLWPHLTSATRKVLLQLARGSDLGRVAGIVAETEVDVEPTVGLAGQERLAGKTPAAQRRAGEFGFWRANLKRKEIVKICFRRFLNLIADRRQSGGQRGGAIAGAREINVARCPGAGTIAQSIA
jgi:hypothetical protein